MDNNMPLITVIMPAYNAEKYIARSVNSILNQTASRLELIVVNDGSTDSTETVLNSIAASDSRLRVLTVPNGGPANARNAALDQVSADTEYIMFCDADDEYMPHTAERALQEAKNGAEMVIMGFTIINPDGTHRDYFEPDGVYFSMTLGNALPDLYKANMLNQVWAKLFKASLILDNGIRFNDYRWGEDRLFIFDCLEKQKKIAVISECLYHYIMHEGESLITGYYDKKPDVCILADKRARMLCERFGVEDDSCFSYMFAKSIFSCLTNLYSPSCRLDEAEKAAYTARIIKDRYIKDRLKNVGGGLPVKAVCAVLLTGSIKLSMNAAKAASAMSKAAPKLFQSLKHRK